MAIKNPSLLQVLVERKQRSELRRLAKKAGNTAPGVIRAFISEWIEARRYEEPGPHPPHNFPLIGEIGLKEKK